MNIYIKVAFSIHVKKTTNYLKTQIINEAVGKQKQLMIDELVYTGSSKIVKCFKTLHDQFSIKIYGSIKRLYIPGKHFCSSPRLFYRETLIP